MGPQVARREGARSMGVSTRRILIVDDEPDVRETFRSYLQRKGFLCSVAADGLQAIRAVRNERIDLVLTDYHMPEIDGLQLLQEVRSISPNLPVVLMSGAADMHVALQALQEHAFDFLSKPIDSGELLKVIGLALAHNAGPAPVKDSGRGIGPVYFARAPEDPSVSLLHFNRPLDQFSVKAFDSSLRRAAAEGELSDRLVLILRNVNYVNSVGINFLLESVAAWQKEGKRVVLTQVSEPLYRYLKLLGHLDRVPNVATIQEAMAAVSGGDK